VLFGFYEHACTPKPGLVEAREEVWLGEVAALEESLTHLRRAEAEAQGPAVAQAPPR
jgi:hypothetical protein